MISDKDQTGNGDLQSGFCFSKIATKSDVEESDKGSDITPVLVKKKKFCVESKQLSE